MVTVKRRVEVFTAGCPVCTEVVGLVRSMACPSCEVRVNDLRDGCATNECREKATRYGVTAVPAVAVEDRKSTRLNSSHDQISYAVLCLKKKKINRIMH